MFFSVSCCGYCAVSVNFNRGTGSSSSLYFTPFFLCYSPSPFLLFLLLPFSSHCLTLHLLFLLVSIFFLFFYFSLDTIFFLFPSSFSLPLFFFFPFLVFKDNLNSRKHPVLDLGSRSSVFPVSFEHVPVTFLTYFLKVKQMQQHLLCCSHGIPSCFR